MKQKRPVSRRLLACLLFGVLVLLMGAYLLITLLPPAEKPAEQGGLRYEPIEGEDIKSNRVYPQVTYEGKNKNATYMDITVEGEDGSFGIFKSERDSTFYMYYFDETGTRRDYLPPLAAFDRNFDYKSLYATDDMGLGTGIPRILYLPVAAGNISFTERIPLTEDTKDEALEAYGLKDSKNRVTILYGDTEGKPVKHTVVIGDIVPGNTGYYILVDDRPYVYASATNTLSYLMRPFSYFVNPVLVAPGTVGAQNSQFEGYLALSFEEFVNQVYTKDDGALTVPADASTVLLQATERLAGEDAVSGVYTYEFMLRTLSDNAATKRLYNYLVGNTLGATSLRFTQLLEGAASRRVVFDGQETLAYEYTVLRVDALLRDDAEITDGTVGTDTQLKITYTCKKAGSDETVTMQGILDLTASGLDADTKARISTLPVGRELSAAEQVAFTYEYTKSNAATKSYDMIIDEIVAIFDNDVMAPKVTETSVVYCRYHYKRGNEVTAPTLGTLDLGSATGEYRERLLAALLDKSTGDNLDLFVYTYTEMYEIVADYAEYDITEITSYVTEEKVVSFGFQNQEDRDPFYRDTYFSNTLPASDKHSLYGLNDVSCQAIVRLMAGLGQNSTSAAGLFGVETVAIGLTAAVKQQYHLYDNRIYVEFPREIKTVTYEGKEITEFRWLYSLGFTMYISDVMYDEDTGEPYRNVGSDMYDIVVRITAETFSFIDYSFTDFWARETMFLVDMATLSSIKMEAFFDDFKGSYDFTIERIQVLDHLWTRLDVIPVGSTYAPLLEAMQALGIEDGKPVGLNALYDHALGVTDAVYGKEYAGDGYFKDFLENLFYISYSGTLSEEDQNSFGTEDNLVLRMTVDMNVKSNLYVYEFYRGSERRVMVRQYRTTEAGEPIGEAVEEFYISSFGLKKIVTGVQELISGRPISGDNEYGG